MPLPADYHRFKVKRLELFHVAHGYCVAEVAPHGAAVWRVYWGSCAEGAKRPLVPTNVLEGGGPVEFPTFARAVAWVAARTADPA